MKIRPLHDRVLVRRAEAEEKTAGGIVLPGAKEKPEIGEVLAVGPGKMCKDGNLCKPDVKKGDRIVFGKYSGNEVKVDGETLLMMREEDIMGVIEA